MAYPTDLDSLSTLTGLESMTTHSSLHNSERDAIDALEAKVGVDSSAVTSSLDYRVGVVETDLTTGSNPGHAHTLAAGATDVTATATELNVLDNIPATLTSTELGYVDGVTSAIQTQLNAKASLTGAETVTNKRFQRRVDSQTTTDTITPEISTYDVFARTAQAHALVINNHSTSTPNDWDMMAFEIVSDATPRAITYGDKYVAQSGVALPSTTVASKTIKLLFIWRDSISKWDLVSANQEA